MRSFDDGNPCAAPRRAKAVAALDSCMSGCRKRKKSPRSVRLVTLAIIAAHISRRTTS
jgi:hypothetical protein